MPKHKTDGMFNKPTLCLDVKKRLIPSLHPMTLFAGWRIGQGQRRDSFLAKVSARQLAGARCLCRVTQPPYIAGPLCIIHVHPAY
jgi:hypothetical protein